METKVTLSYSGAALDAGRMSAYEVAKHITGFADFLAAAAKATYGADADINAQVSSFAADRFQTEFFIDVLSPIASAAPLLAHLPAPVTMWQVVKGAFELWKFLEGCPPAAVANADGTSVVVTNHNGAINQFSVESLNLVLDQDASNAVDKFLRQPLRRVDIASVDIDLELGSALPPITISASEGPFFKSVAEEEVVSENIVTRVVEVVRPAFARDKKWGLFDGDRTFMASVEDVGFLDRVDGGEKFAKGDAVEVIMRVEQKRKGRRSTHEWTVIQVLRRITPQTQIGLDLLSVLDAPPTLAF